MFKNFALAALLGLFGTAAFAAEPAKKEETTAPAEAGKEEKKPEEHNKEEHNKETK